MSENLTSVLLFRNRKKKKKNSKIRNRKSCSSELISRKIVEMIRCRNIE